MCGINGIYAYHYASEAPRETEAIATRDFMQGRGPDGAGLWRSPHGRMLLGHRRLSIIDQSARSNQPMLSADGQLAVTFNGEIYNYPELRADLEAEGAVFRTTSDTEVLLHLYARHGAAMVSLLRGMFAFAIWDDRAGGLFLARDIYGIKPLYTANDGWTFRFASQVKALLAGGGAISRDPEPAGVVGFHLFGSVPEPFTVYRDIRSLPAGHTQWVDEAGPREPKAYGSIAGIVADGAEAPVSALELPERVRAAVGDSVHAHLLADVEVGIFLSAGVDSGALLGLMRDAGQTSARAITLAFDEFRGSNEDEAPLAGEVAERYGARHVVRRVSEREFRDDLPAIFDAMDQPSIDGVNTWFVAKAAKEAGLKVALSGLGGDELLAGYPSFTDLPRWRRRFGAVAAVPGAGRLAREIFTRFMPGLTAKQPKAASMIEYAGSWSGAYLLRRGLHMPHELAGLLDPDIAREGLRRLQPLRRIAASVSPDPGSNPGRIGVMEAANYMRNQLLRDADWAGMAHSIEIRVPLVDTILLRRMAPVIPHLTAGAGKGALAAAPTVALPDSIVTRAKTGFGVPTGAWLDAVGTAPGRRTSRSSKGIASRDWSQAVFDRLMRSAAVAPAKGLS